MYSGVWLKGDTPGHGACDLSGIGGQKPFIIFNVKQYNTLLLKVRSVLLCIKFVVWQQRVDCSNAKFLSSFPDG
jgi:hypothetical protein